MRKPKFLIDLNEQFSHLDRAPIVEAVIHWAARYGKTLSPDDLRSLLTERLPEYPKIQSQHQMHLESMITHDGTSRHSRQDTWHGLRLTSADQLFVIQFTRDGLVFSRLAPYEDWDKFSTEAIRLWKLYCELTEPPEVQRLGVRFINQFPIRELKEIRRYLKQPPKCLESMGLPTEQFLYQSVHRVPNEPYKINIVRTVQPIKNDNSGGLGVIIDIDTSTDVPFPASVPDTQRHLGNLRWLKDKAFFSLVQAKAISEFIDKKEPE